MWNIFKKKEKTKYYYYILRHNNDTSAWAYIDKTGGFDFNFVCERAYQDGIFDFNIQFFKEITKQEFDTFNKIDTCMTEKKMEIITERKTNKLYIRVGIKL